MGDAADELYDHEMEQQELLDAAKARGDYPCPVCAVTSFIDMDCPKCDGHGWLTKDGTPIELW